MGAGARFTFWWLPRGTQAFTPPVSMFTGFLFWGTDEIRWGTDRARWADV